MSTSAPFLLQTGRHYLKQKSEHTRSKCDPCRVHHLAMPSIFPNAVRLKPQKLVRDGLTPNKSNGNVKQKRRKKKKDAVERERAKKKIKLRLSGPRGQSNGGCFTSSQPQMLPSGCKTARTKKISARENVEFDKENLLQEVRNKKDAENVIYQQKQQQ